MAEFKVGIEGDASGLKNALKSVNSDLDKFNSDLLKSQKSLSGNINESKTLEQELKKLASSNKSGAISAEEYAKRNNELRQRLESVRANITYYQKSVSDLKIKIDGLSASTANNTNETNKNNNVLIRHVALNKAALSASNNLTRSLATVAAGGKGAASGIGVFIRQLATVQASSLGLAGTFTALGSALLGPAGIAIGISVVTSAITTYISNTNSAKKSTEDLDTSTKKIIANLDSLAQAMLAGEQAAVKESNTLKRLYDASRNTSLSISERTKAAKLLQDTYPETFKNFSKEEIMLGKAEAGYKSLATAIIAKAKASAAADRIAENSITILENDISIRSTQSDIDRLNLELQRAKNREAKAGAGIGQGAVFYAREQAAIQAKIADKESEINTLKARNIPLNGSNLVLEKEIQKAISEQGVSVLGVTEAKEKAAKATKEQVRDMSTLSDITKQIKTYTDSYNEALKAQERINKLKKEESDLWFKIDQLVSGDKVESKLQKDLKSLNDAFAKLRTNAPKDITTQAGLSMQQRLSETKIEAKYVYEVNKENNLALLKQNEEAMKQLTSGLKRATNQFVSDMISGLSNIKGGFDIIFSNLTSSFQSLFANQISNQLKGVFEKNIENMGVKMSNLVAGLGVAGSIISGNSKPTSAVGKGIGGAVSGAAIGSTILPGIGTAIGGILGGLSGILGAGKARKEEIRIQEEQLRVQKEQLEQSRKAAQAFSSSIIGQMTNQGIVGRIDRDAMGNLVAETRIEGTELVTLLKRVEAQR